jgi:hypothetical protein
MIGLMNYSLGNIFEIPNIFKNENIQYVVLK